MTLQYGNTTKNSILLVILLTKRTSRRSLFNKLREWGIEKKKRDRKQDGPSTSIGPNAGPLVLRTSPGPQQGDPSAPIGNRAPLLPRSQVRIDNLPWRAFQEEYFTLLLQLGGIYCDIKIARFL